MDAPAHVAEVLDLEPDGLGVLRSPVMLIALTGLFDIGGAATAALDRFAPADLALQEGVRMLWELPDRPRERALREMAAAWSPWRTVAAGMLWAYYGAMKRRDGVM